MLIEGNFIFQFFSFRTKVNQFPLGNVHILIVYFSFFSHLLLPIFFNHEKTEQRNTILFNHKIR
jgi:hypothetical protein